MKRRKAKTTPNETTEKGREQDYSKGAGVVHAVTVYKGLNRSTSATKKYSTAYKNATIEQLIAVYKNSALPKDERDWALNEAYLKVFFLLPHMVKQHKYSLNATLFDDAMQNLSLAFLNAVRRFNPEYGTKFVYYFVGDMLSAMRKTFRDSNIVKIPTAKLKKAGYIVEEQVGYEPLTQDSDDIENCIDTCIADNSQTIACYDMGDGDGLYSYDYEDSQSDIGTDRVISSKLVAYDDGVTRSTYDIEEDMYSRELHDWLEELLSKEADIVTPEEREILILHNGLLGRKAMMYSEIVKLKKEAGSACSRSKISAIHSSAIRKLTDYITESGLKLN